MLNFSKSAENYEAVQRIFRLNNINPYWGAEVGVRKGDFSEFILINNKNLILFCVDPYLPYMDVNENYTKEMQTEVKNFAAVRLNNLSDRIRFIYLPSTDAALYLAGVGPVRGYLEKFCLNFEGLDFVFIDAEHTYEAVKNDLNAWAPLIRPGGILMGHDFSMSGVQKAVLEWAVKNGYKDTPIWKKEGDKIKGIKRYNNEILHTEPDQADVWAIKLRE